MANLENKDLLTRITIAFDNVKVLGTHLIFKDLGRGRFIEERNLEVMVIGKGGERTHLLYLKVFNGRPPHYRPWVEVFGINPDVKFFRTPLEDYVLEKLSEALGHGESLFLEYYLDLETQKALKEGLPPEETPLGRKLSSLGFRWFKDWYFPEGALEGGQKLQAQK